MEASMIEVDAVARDIASTIYKRAAEAMVLVVDFLEERDLGLNQLQKVELASTMLNCFDGTRQEIEEAVEKEISCHEDVQRKVGGLSPV